MPVVVQPRHRRQIIATLSGTTRRIHDELREAVRVLAGRRPARPPRSSIPSRSRAPTPSAKTAAEARQKAAVSAFQRGGVVHAMPPARLAVPCSGGAVVISSLMATAAGPPGEHADHADDRDYWKVDQFDTMVIDGVGERREREREGTVCPRLHGRGIAGNSKKEQHAQPDARRQREREA